MQAATSASATATTSYPITVVILFAFLVVSMIGNIILFNRGHESYSIKYQLFFKSPYFRQHPFACSVVEIIYKSFFAVPFILLGAIAVIRAISHSTQFFTIILNGMIVLMTIYPMKDQWYFRSKFIILALVIGAQFDTLYHHIGTSTIDTYSVISTIFYPLNAIVFSLAVLASQQDYWELNNAIDTCKDQLSGIYKAFTKEKEEDKEEGKFLIQEEGGDSKVYIEQKMKKPQKPMVKYEIPQIFDGGIYGSLCRNKKARACKKFCLYFLSLVLLAANALLVWVGGSSLGIIGLVTNLIYDIFIFAFASLKIQQRSIRNIFLLIFLGRIMSFVFGQSLWIFGYCFLYLIVGTFIGKIIIDQKFPLRKIKKKKKEHRQHQEINALKTPEFVLLILTAQVFLLVLAASLNVGNSNLSYTLTTSTTSINIALWNFALIAVMLTWIIILFMGSYRMIQQQRNNIHSQTQFYFGAKNLKTHHISVLITYLIIIALGLYCQFFLFETTAFLSCVFLPPIILLLIKFQSQWENNQYQVLADIDQYNKKVQKMKKVIQKKQKALIKQQLNLGSTQQIPSDVNLASVMKLPAGNNQGQTSKLMLLEEKQSQGQSQTTTQVEEKEAAVQESRQLKLKMNSLEEKKFNWREFQGKIGPLDWFNNFLTSSDRWLLVLIFIEIIFFAAYTILTYLIAGTIFGMLVVLSILALLTHSPFFRFSRTFKDIDWPQYVWYYFGWISGVVYWAFYRNDTIYMLAWSGFYIISAVAMIIAGLIRNIPKNYVYLMMVNILLTMIFACIILFLTVSIFPASLVTVILIVLCIGAIPIAYNNLEGSIPKWVKILCAILICLGVASIAVFGRIFNVASNFAVFSFVLGAIYIVLFAMANIMYLDRQDDKYQTPHVYSSYGKPIYKFQSRTQKLKSSISHKIIYDMSTIVLVIYAAGVTLLFTQKQFAIYALGYYCSITFLQDILFSIKTQNQLVCHKGKLTQPLISKALKELNDKYMVDFHKNTYSKEVEIKKYQLKEKAEQAEDEQLDKSYSNLARKHQQFILNGEEQEKFLFFWLALIEFQILTDQKEGMVKLLTEVKEIEPQLIQYGIFIQSVNFAISDIEAKYELVTEQLQSLHPFDFVRYRDILEKHQKQSSLKDYQQKQLAEDIQRQQKKRQDLMFTKMKAQLGKSGNDKIDEFNKMLGQVEAKRKFVDEEFKADQEVLGAGLGSIVSKWRRPRKGENLVKGGFSPYDIKQGQIGDCYLVSSMGVLGQKWIKSSMGGCRTQGEPLAADEWLNQKGAYMVRFHKFLKTVYVIVDDQLPVDSHDNFIFAKSQDPEQIWPCIIQKAYAKLYGGYMNIVEGKCHRVFAQFTGGFPSQLATADYKSNPNSLWQRIISSKENQYLMAAGSPSHADGDSAHSARGIVQGHAYALLDARVVEGNRLMKLKNPHGSGGIEWTGDFSDGTQLMTKRLMQLLEHQNKDDGVFWMKLEDFIYQFKSLYLCAIFNPDKWLQLKTIQSKFTQQNSFGLPKSSDQTFRNPQYGITVTKKCTFFVNMVQEAQNSILGKNTIYMRIQKSQGKRITKHNTRSDLLCGNQLRPINSITLSNQAVFQAEKYPYTFTLYVSCDQQACQGDFKLQMYCSDKEATLIDDPQFDRELFD